MRGDVLLREEILGGLLNMYRPRKELAPVTKAFIRRFNIVDPLLPTNNLGKSINIASKYRIREALTHGSRVLASIFAKVGSCLVTLQISLAGWTPHRDAAAPDTGLASVPTGVGSCWSPCCGRGRSG